MFSYFCRVMFCAWLSSGLTGFGHTLPISFLSVVPDTDYLHLELTLNPFELSFARELDTDSNGRIDPKEWEAQEKVVGSWILGCFKLNAGGRTLVPEIYGVNPDPESHHITLRAHYREDMRHLPLQIESTLAAITSGSHLTRVTVSGPRGPQYAQLDMGLTSASFAPVERPGEAPTAERVRPPRDEWLKWMFLVGTIANFGWAGAAMRHDAKPRAAIRSTRCPQP